MSCGSNVKAAAAAAAATGEAAVNQRSTSLKAGKESGGEETIKLTSQVNNYSDTLNFYFRYIVCQG